MPKTYRAKALDTGEWVYGDEILFTGNKAYIPIKDYDSEELVCVNIATAGHSLEVYDIDNIQLFTHDIVYVKTSSGTAFVAELLDIAGTTYLQDIGSKEKGILDVECTLKLKGTLYDLDNENFYPF